MGTPVSSSVFFVPDPSYSAGSGRLGHALRTIPAVAPAHTPTPSGRASESSLTPRSSPGRQVGGGDASWRRHRRGMEVAPSRLFQSPMPTAQMRPDRMCSVVQVSMQRGSARTGRARMLRSFPLTGSARCGTIVEFCQRWHRWSQARPPQQSAAPSLGLSPAAQPAEPNAKQQDRRCREAEL